MGEIRESPYGKSAVVVWFRNVTTVLNTITPFLPFNKSLFRFDSLILPIGLFASILVHNVAASLLTPSLKATCEELEVWGEGGQNAVDSAM